MGLIADIFIASNKGAMEKAYHDMMNDPRLIAATNKFDASRDALDRAMGNPILTPEQRRMMYGLAELYCSSEDNKNSFKNPNNKEEFVKMIMNVPNTTESMAAYIFKESISYGKIHEELIEFKKNNKSNVIAEEVIELTEEEKEKEEKEEKIKIINQKASIVSLILAIIVGFITFNFWWGLLTFAVASGMTEFLNLDKKMLERKENKSVDKKPKTIKNKRIKNRAG